MKEGEIGGDSDQRCEKTGLLTEGGVKREILADNIEIWLLVSGVRGTPKKRKYRDSAHKGLDISIKKHLSREDTGKHKSQDSGGRSAQNECDGVCQEAHKESELARNFIKNNITGSSVDVTFDSFQQTYCLNQRQFLPKRGKWKRPEDSGYYIEVPPKSTVTVWTREWLRTSKVIAAVIQSKVSNVLYGFSHVSTTINPNWDGELLITFTNTLDEPLRLDHGDTLASIVFFRVPDRSDRIPDVTSERNRQWMLSYASDAEQKCKENRIFRWSWLVGVSLFYLISFAIICFFVLDSKYAFLDLDGLAKVGANPWFVAVTLLSLHLAVKPFFPPLDEKIRIILSSILGSKI